MPLCAESNTLPKWFPSKTKPQCSCLKPTVNPLCRGCCGHPSDPLRLFHDSRPWNQAWLLTSHSYSPLPLLLSIFDDRPQDALGGKSFWSAFSCDNDGTEVSAGAHITGHLLPGAKVAGDWLGSCGWSRGSMVMNLNDLGRPWQATMQLAARGCLGRFQTEAGWGRAGARAVRGCFVGGWGLYMAHHLRERPREGHLIKTSSCSETTATPERCIMSHCRLQGGGPSPAQ